MYYIHTVIPFKKLAKFYFIALIVFAFRIKK